MKTILLVPLDERPCNYQYQSLMVKDTDFTVKLPPLSILGKKKTPGDPDRIFDWLYEHAADCDGAVISIDALVYSSILASRLHQDPLSVLSARIARLRDLKAAFPLLKLFGFTLIMRNPRYSSGDEEPDYYEYWGREIHRYGVIRHKMELSIETQEEREEYDDICRRLPQEYLNDYLSRREKNIEINKMAIDLVRDGILDFMIVPQDDSSPYGLTAKDQQAVRSYIRSTHTQLSVYMYPDADAVENTLIARMINEANGVRPLVYIKYASALGSSVIPLYEDRLVNETIKYQILAAGGLVASSVQEADLVLMINTPGGNPKEHGIDQPIPPTIEYDAYRNQIEQVEYASYAMETLHKPVCFADVAYGNGGDPELFSLLKEKGILYSVAGYAGWNTSSNTLGTAIPMAMIFCIYGPRRAHEEYLAARYLEDIGYMAFVRREVCTEELEKRGLTYFLVDGEEGQIASIVKEKLQAFADQMLCDDTHHVVLKTCRMPWNRMFETEVHVCFE